MRIATQVVLTSAQRAKLEAFARGRSAPARFVQRARIVLLAAQGKQELRTILPRPDRESAPARGVYQRRSSPRTDPRSYRRT